MIRSRGFSLLEVMLALVVVAIGISVLLAFSASNQRESSNKATGNDDGIIVNHILEEFVTANSTCSASNTDCDLLTSAPPKDENPGEPAGDYLARQSSNVVSQQDAINATKIFVSIKSCRSDVEYTNGCP